MRERKSKSLETLRSAEVVRHRLELSQSLEHMYLASHISELCLALCPEGQPSKELFFFLQEVLDRLPKVSSEQILLVRRPVELRLLNFGGFGLPLSDAQSKQL